MSNMSIKKEMTYSERLIFELQTAGCPTSCIDVVQKFMLEERQKKEQFAAANHGVLTFGKYKGKHIEGVFKLDPSYCQWLHDKSAKFLRADIKDMLAVLLK